MSETQTSEQSIDWKTATREERNAWLFVRLEGAKWYLTDSGRRFLASPLLATRRFREASGDEPLHSGWEELVPHYDTQLAAAYQIGDWMQELGLAEKYGATLAGVACGKPASLFNMVHASAGQRAYAAYLTLTHTAAAEGEEQGNAPPFGGLNIFEDCARRCPYCRCTSFSGTASSEVVKCMDCGKHLRPDELTEPDWKLRAKAEGKE